MMKKLILSLALLLISASSQAQLNMGFKAGALASNISYRGIGLAFGSQEATKFSYLAGAVFAYPVYDKGYLQAELLYSKEGFRAYEKRGLEVYKNHLHYLSFPLLLQHEVAYGLSVGAGPEISYLLAAYQQTEDNGSLPLNWYRPFELGINLNVQYRLLKQLEVGLRYNLGLSDTTETIKVSYYRRWTFVIDSFFYNRSLQLSLLYWLR